MKFSGYNLINQRLDSEWLIKLLRFCSNDYSGAIGEDENSDPFSPSELTDNNFSLSECTLAVGGHTVDMTGETISATVDDGTQNFFGIVLSLDKDKESTNITTNDLANVEVGFINDFTIKQIRSEESDELTGYFKIKNTSNQGWDRYHYDTQKFDVVYLTLYGSEERKNMYNAYIIPVAGFDTETQKAVRLLGYKTGSALEEFLTQAALDKLIDMLNDRYVWREGGANVSERGNIGNLNVTNNAITSKPNFENYGGTNQDGFISDNSITLDSRYLLLKRQKGLYDNTYSEFYPSGVLAIPAPGFGVFSYPQLQLRFGGTNADNFWDARKNLQIITTADRPGVKYNGKAPTQYNAPEGTIYLSIVE